MELPYAGIHQLCAPMLPRLDALPQPQQDGLRVALGLASGQVPERFLVGLAVLGLLSAEAEERPLICLVDDAQWLDAASGLILGFVARRLLAESVAIVVAVREPSARHDFDGLPELPLRGLTAEDARTLLMRAVPGPLDDRVRDRIVAETRGNPLALVDLPRSTSAAELASGFELLAATDLPRHLEDHYLERADELPEPTQRLLLLAAAEPMGDATLVWRAAHRLGIERSALGPAEDAQLVEIGARVRFRHPLVRSAAYRAAVASERRAAHAALAEVTDPDSDPDRRAWHRAHAAVGVDESVAGELESSADRAQARGGGGGCGVPGARSRADSRSGGAREAGPGCRAGEVRCCGIGRGARVAGDRRACPARRASTRPKGAVARGDRVHPHARQGRSGVVARCRPAPRTARRRDGSRDPSGGDGGGDVRLVASATNRASARLPGPLWLRRRRRSRHGRSTCCSTVWRRGSPGAMRPVCRRCGARWTRFAAWRS